jgi:hypothetical protein
MRADKAASIWARRRAEADMALSPYIRFLGGRFQGGLHPFWCNICPSDYKGEGYIFAAANTKG